jgi:polyisoprenoid-binding protein YceI
MLRRRTPALALLALAVALPAAAAPASIADLQGGHYVLDPRHASVIARVSHMGVSLYTVRFDTLDGSFEYDPGHPERTHVQASVDPASLDVGYSTDFAKEFLSADRFPKAR